SLPTPFPISQTPLRRVMWTASASAQAPASPIRLLGVESKPISLKGVKCRGAWISARNPSWPWALTSQARMERIIAGLVFGHSFRKRELPKRSPALTLVFAPSFVVRYYSVHHKEEVLHRDRFRFEAGDQQETQPPLTNIPIRLVRQEPLISRRERLDY